MIIIKMHVLKWNMLLFSIISNVYCYNNHWRDNEKKIRVQPELLKLPDIVYVDYNSVIIRVDNNSIIGYPKPTEFYIKYQTNSDYLNNQLTTPLIQIETNYTVNNLKPGTFYKFQLVFVINEKDYKGVDFSVLTEFLPLITENSIEFEVKYTYILIKINDDTIIRPPKPMEFRIECDYKGSGNWHNFKNITNRDFDESSTYELRNLIPNISHRFLVNFISNNIIYLDKATFYKTTAFPSPTWYTKNVGNDFITFQIIPSNNDLINSEEIDYSIKYKILNIPVNDWIYQSYRNHELYTINNLKSNTNYEFQLIFKINGKEYPSKLGSITKLTKYIGPVQSITVGPTSCDSVNVTWSPPYNTVGYIKYYVLLQKLRQLSHVTSNYTNTNMIILNQLQNNVEYKITITPINEYNLEGTQNNLKFNTSFNIPVSEDELPNIDLNNLIILPYRVKIRLPECSKMKGPLTYYFKLVCLSEWCNGNTKYTNISYNVDTKEAVFYPLTPYTNYTLSFDYVRNSMRNSSEKVTRLLTKLWYPPLIKKYIAYKIDENNIYIQWKAPYPPHGILEKMILKQEKNTIYDFITPNCQLIDDTEEYCYITQLTPWTHFQISTKNFNSIYINTTIKIDDKNDYRRPEPPTNLSYKIQDDDIYLQWTYSQPTNKQNISFHLIFENIHTHKYKIRNYTPKNITEPYTYKMKDVIHSSSHNVYVAVVHEPIGMSASITIHTFPPKLKFINNLETEIKDTLNIKIKIPVISEASQLSKTSFLVILIQTLDDTTDNTTSITNEMCNNLIKQSNFLPNNAWIAGIMDVSSEEITFILGSENTTNILNVSHVRNKMLQDDTEYKITTLLYNTYKDVYSCEGFSVNSKTDKSINNKLFLLSLLLVLLIPIIGCFIYRNYCINKSKDVSASLHQTPKENIDLNHIENKSKKHDKSMESSKQTVPTKSPQIETIQKRTELPEQLLDKNNEKLVVIVKPDSKSKTNMKRKVNSIQPTQEASINGPKSSKYSKLIKKCELENYLKKALFNDEIKKQHALFTRDLTEKHDYGLLEENRTKNRYKNLIPYEHTRVKLKKINNDPYSDYINANYINGYNQRKAYIATQGPKENTVCDFWRMIWEQNVQYIIMLTNTFENGKKKCEKYWPDMNKSVTYGGIKITFIHNDLYADFECRMFEVTKDNFARNIYQYHYTSWPDHGVPLYPQLLITFLRMIQKIELDQAPLLVHCSAGVGRTGTIILIDICLRMAAAENAVDCLRYLSEIRSQRACLVDNIEQYKFVHLVLLEYLTSPAISIPHDEYKRMYHTLLDTINLQDQLTYLNQIDWQNNVFSKPLMIIQHKENANKNRLPDVLPENEKITIPKYPESDNFSNYINAVPVSGYKYTNQFIVTQIPLPNTLEDFWRMILHTNSQIIVSLNNIPLDDKTCCEFWPDIKRTMKLSCGIKLTYVSFDNHDTHKVIKLKMKHEKTVNTIHIIQFKNWNHKDNVPKNIESFLFLCDEIENLARGKYPIVISCYDGVTASGILVGFSFITEKIKMEQECDIYLAVRIIRKNRKQFIRNKVQLEFLYKSTLKYLQMYETYSNFS